MRNFVIKMFLILTSVSIFAEDKGSADLQAKMAAGAAEIESKYPDTFLVDSASEHQVNAAAFSPWICEMWLVKGEIVYGVSREPQGQPCFTAGDKVHGELNTKNNGVYLAWLDKKGKMHTGIYYIVTTKMAPQNGNAH